MVLLALIGCTGGWNAVGDTGGVDVGEDPESVFEGLELREQCEGFDGQPIPGATSYFYGDFVVRDGQVEGNEYWFLLANDRWEELGEGDCQVTWAVQGTTAEGGCPVCDYSMSFDAQANPAKTDCPDGLWMPEREYAVTYDVWLQDEGGAEVYFFESGNPLATGAWEGDRLTYLTEPRCMFF